jgi:large subunit ribosomal protein L6
LAMSTKQIEEQAIVSKKNRPQSIALDLPEGVAAIFENGQLTVKGPLGKVEQDFSKIPVGIKISHGKIEVATTGSRRTDNAVLNTARSLLRNAIEGVKFGYEYKLKVIFAHFPVTVKVQGKNVLIENFYGERSPPFNKGCRSDRGELGTSHNSQAKGSARFLGWRLRL